MSEISLLRTLFRYQAWANGDLLDSIGRLHVAHHGKERHTAIRLMNHSLVVARIFAAHLTGREHGYVDDNTAETLPAGASYCAHRLGSLVSGVS